MDSRETLKSVESCATNSRHCDASLDNFHDGSWMRTSIRPAKIFSRAGARGSYQVIVKAPSREDADPRSPRWSSIRSISNRSCGFGSNNTLIGAVRERAQAIRAGRMKVTDVSVVAAELFFRLRRRRALSVDQEKDNSGWECSRSRPKPRARFRETTASCQCEVAAIHRPTRNRRRNDRASQKSAPSGPHLDLDYRTGRLHDGRV